MSPIRSLLLALVAATCLLLCVFTFESNAQDVTGLTNCVKYGNHIIQWTIATRADGTTRYMRARYIKKGGYKGWAAFGFRYGYSWSIPVQDPDNNQQPEKMGDNTNPATIYMVFRSPDTDRHYFYEMKGTSNNAPSTISAGDYVTQNVTVRSAVNGDMHLYFERDLIAKTNSRNYFSFNESSIECNLMFATSDVAAINSLNDFSESSHNSAKILKYNLIAKTGIDAGSLGSCTAGEMNAAIPAYRTPKEIVEPSTGGNTKNTAPISQSVFLVAYLMGALILGLFAYF